MLPPPHLTLIPLPAELRSERVLLRPLVGEDAPAVFAAIDESRALLRPWMEWVDKHQTVDDTLDYCLQCQARWLLRSDLALGIFAPETGQFLGGTGFVTPDWTVRVFEIGYWIRASAEGHGYVGDAMRLLVELAFRDLEARRVAIFCDAQNRRSQRVAERAGFVHEGTMRNDSLSTDGEIRSTLVFSLIPEDYARLVESSRGAVETVTGTPGD